MSKIITIREKYQKTVVPELQKQLKLDNAMMVPRVDKIVVNVGIGPLLKEKEAIKELKQALIDITGQMPVMTTAKRSIASFKIREGQEIGMKVTLRGTRMMQFLDRMINEALPRTRDFQGIPRKAVDHNGNLNIGIKEHTIFPEISAENARKIYGFQITIVSSTDNEEVGEALFRSLGFPIQKEDH